MNRNLFLISILSLALFSCEDKETTPSLPYESGVVVVNEGNFTDNNGTLSWLNRNAQTATFDIFQYENKRSLSGSVRGYTEVDDKGIILVDNSTAGNDAVEIVNANTFTSIASITPGEIENPRQVVRVSNTKAYISCWNATGDFPDFYVNPGYIAVLDLNTNMITKKINIEKGAESMFMFNNQVYVGSADYGVSKMTVINVSNDAIDQTVEVGSNPTIIGVDINNRLWVYAGGQIKKINTSSKAVESTVTLTSTKSPSRFAFSTDKSILYFVLSAYDANWNEVGAVYSTSVNASEIKEGSPLINRMFGGGMAVDPQTGELYAGLIPSYKQAGYVFRFKANGTLIDSVKAEIAPSKFFFK